MSGVMSNAICVKNIPQELREHGAWVVWRVERQAGRLVKPPYDPRTGHRASCSDPDTWGSVEEALAAHRGGGYDGIGFQLTAPFVGVDLDGCRDPETGFIDDGALAIIKQLNSYTEVSPSGCGLHIFVKGTLPPVGRRTNGVEMYDGSHYLTVTGEHVAGTPLVVEGRNQALTTLHTQAFGNRRRAAEPRQVEPLGPTRPHASLSVSDEDLIAKMQASGNGDRFERLWRGEWEDVTEYPSQSEADFDLCRTFLAFWTGNDPERMDRLFRLSGLYRPKWDERHGARTYGEITIANAIRTQQFTWTSPQGSEGERHE